MPLAPGRRRHVLVAVVIPKQPSFLRPTSRPHVNLQYLGPKRCIRCPGDEVAPEGPWKRVRRRPPDEVRPACALAVIPNAVPSDFRDLRPRFPVRCA